MGGYHYLRYTGTYNQCCGAGPFLTGSVSDRLRNTAYNVNSLNTVNVSTKIPLKFNVIFPNEIFLYILSECSPCPFLT